MFCLGSFIISAQSLEPRSLSRVPIQANFVFGAYAYSQGNYILDENIVIKDLKSNVHSLTFGGLRTFKLFNKTAKLGAIVPYSLGKWSAAVSNIDTSVLKTGFGDPFVKFSMLFIGGEPLQMQDFVKHQASPFTLGMFFRVRVPLGSYDKSKLINLGAK